MISEEQPKISIADSKAINMNAETINGGSIVEESHNSKNYED